MKGKNGSRRHKVQGRKMVIWNWLVMVKLEKTTCLGDWSWNENLQDWLVG